MKTAKEDGSLDAILVREALVFFCLAVWWFIRVCPTKIALGDLPALYIVWVKTNVMTCSSNYLKKHLQQLCTRRETTGKSFCPQAHNFWHVCTCSLQKSVESLSFSEPAASKPIEPSATTFAASSSSPHSTPPPAPADRPPAARPPAAEKGPDIAKKAAVQDDQVREMFPCWL